jgi:hypothetical protein
MRLCKGAAFEAAVPEPPTGGRANMRRLESLGGRAPLAGWSRRNREQIDRADSDDWRRIGDG